MAPACPDLSTAATPSPLPGLNVDWFRRFRRQRRVPRMLSSTKRGAADPGSVLCAGSKVPALRSSVRTLHRVRDTSWAKRLLRRGADHLGDLVDDLADLFLGDNQRRR